MIKRAIGVRRGWRCAINNSSYESQNDV